MANGLAYEMPPRPAVVTIPAEHRRTVAGAIYAAAASLDALASKAPTASRRRARLVREAQELREIAEDIA